jgi:hypothetical protein
MTNTDVKPEAGIRIVAFLDVLGFRKWVETRPLAEIVNKYLAAADAAEEMRDLTGLERESSSIEKAPASPASLGTLCHRYAFSDSIILVSMGAEDIDCLRLLAYAWRLSQFHFSIGLPLRGGVFRGEVFHDRSRNLVLGRALTGAYLLEKDQEWMGIAIDRSVSDAHQSLLTPANPKAIARGLFPEWEVPFKNGVRARLHVVNWRFNLISKPGTKAFLRYDDLVRDEDQSVRAKAQNTLDFAAAMKQRGLLYPKRPEATAPELRPFAFGDSSPPFQHGDEY